MEQRGGCCIARYASKVDSIMLRFRPIAPKPASAGGSHLPAEVKNSVRSSGRGKRKRGESNSSRRKRKISKRKSDSDQKEVITLPLLRESPERRGRSMWLSFGGEMEMERRRVVVWSWVKVECVYEYGGSLERVRRLEGDESCPGFVSDGMNRVIWMNDEYGRMVGGDEVVGWVVGVPAPEKEEEEEGFFTCRVKVVTWRMGEKRPSPCKTVPCDVWRIQECGGFAWRLDTMAALSLSL